VRTRSSLCTKCGDVFELPIGHARPFCTPCSLGQKCVVESRASRIARGDLNLGDEGATAAEMAAILRNRRAMNVTGA
jgi:hypothetical protein